LKKYSTNKKNKEMKFNPGFDIEPTIHPFGFKYGKGIFGPQVEIRTLDAIRNSLMNPQCDGPEEVYSIAMDVGKLVHKKFLRDRNLLFGVVTYASGRLGNEPIRSQGHVHKKTRNNTLSPPEIYEIWAGKAIIYMQEYVEDHPGRCYAVEAGPGEVVIVPPDWAHATISADPETPLTFGAWCDRDYGFEYEGVRAHKGLAWFPVYNSNNQLEWHANPHYQASQLIMKNPENYNNLGIVKNEPIYVTFEKEPDTFLYVSNPGFKKTVWQTFVP
jgi:glucose-6-phosphate isomerase, archaeal